MDINQKLTEELNVKRWQIDAAVKLIDEGNTIPLSHDTERKLPDRSTTSSSGSCMRG